MKLTREFFSKVFDVMDETCSMDGFFVQILDGDSYRNLMRMWGT